MISAKLACDNAREDRNALRYSKLQDGATLGLCRWLCVGPILPRVVSGVRGRHRPRVGLPVGLFPVVVIRVSLLPEVVDVTVRCTHTVEESLSQLMNE